jgi:hypothetical protein
LNILIAAAVGGVLALISLIGGVAAYQGQTDGVPQNSLYNYAAN